MDDVEQIRVIPALPMLEEYSLNTAAWDDHDIL